MGNPRRRRGVEIHRIGGAPAETSKRKEAAMGRRLFQDLVVCRNGTNRNQSRSVATLPISAALHAMAVAALAMLSVGGVSRASLPFRRVMFHPPPTPLASPPPSMAVGMSRPSRRGEAHPVIVDPGPPAVSDPPSLVVGDEALDAPIGDSPICLWGCAPGGSGADDSPGMTGSGGTTDGPGPPRRVGGEIQEPRRIQGAPPAYPELARRAGVEGQVVLECVIDAGGAVTDLRVVSGPPLLTAAALDAVRRWVYSPTRLNGQPVSVILTVTVRFKLDHGLGPAGSGVAAWR